MMKNRLVYFATVVFCLCCVFASAQVNLNNQKTYGIWQWLSSPLSKKVFPEIRGRMYNPRWADIEPSPNVWDWTSFDNEIQSRVNDSLPFIFKVYTKEDAPMWLYSNGVPKVLEKDNAGIVTGWAPYYADSDYKYYFERMITSVRKHIETYPPYIRNYIIGVQGCYGSTGDYISYKGNVDAQYALTSDQFFDLYKEFSLYYFNEYANTTPKIYVVSNPQYSSRQNYEWTAANLPGSWYKCASIGKGYQLNDEKSKSGWLYRILNDPQSDGNYIRARSEITHDGLLTHWWEEIPYQNMLNIMCYAIYWGVDWSNQGYNQFNDHFYDSAFYFFNKYAGQKNPLTSKNALCALKDVIDAADSDRFPVSTFGPVVRSATRFNSVLAPFAAYGAKLEDVANAVVTEYENIHAQGINDVGWDLLPGNYERWIHQLNANNTSTGYWNISTSADKNSMYGKFVRGFEISKNKTALYFDLDDGFLGNQPLNGNYPVTIDITYLDSSTGSWQLYYDSKASGNKLAYTITCTNTKLWKKKSITLTDAYFGNRANQGSDFYIISNSGNTKNVLFSMVELSRNTDLTTIPGLYSSAILQFDTVCVNSMIDPQVISISGSGLTSGSVTIGPKNGFSFSLTKDGVFRDSIILNNLSSSCNSILYIKFNPQAEGSYSGGIPFKGAGVTATIIPVRGYAVNTSPLLDANVTNISCNGKKDGAIDLIPSGGTAPFTYTWSSSAQTFFSPVTQDISNLQVANYTVTVNSYKCSASKTFSIIEPDVLTISVAADNPIVCKGGTTTVQVNASGGTIPYSGTGTFTVTYGTKTYTVTDNRSCKVSKSYFIANGTQSAPSKPAGINGPSSASKLQAGVVFSVKSPNANYKYVWTVPSDATITAGQNTSSITVTWGRSSGNVTAKAQNDCGTSAGFSKFISLSASLAVAQTNSSLVAEEAIITNAPMAIMPNPAKDFANIRFYVTTASNYRIRVADIQGRIIMEKIVVASLGTNLATFNIGGLATGEYFISVENNKGERQSGKLVKQ